MHCVGYFLNQIKTMKQTKFFDATETPKGRDVRAVKAAITTTARDVYATGKNELTRDSNKTKSPGELGGLNGFPG